MTGRVSTCVSRAGGARELLHNPTQPHVLLLREQLILKCAPQVKRGAVQHALTQFLGYKYGKIKGRVIKRDKKRPSIHDTRAVIPPGATADERAALKVQLQRANAGIAARNAKPPLSAPPRPLSPGALLTFRLASHIN